ncbi:hypothetical protein C6P46_006573 [Rhodotorula mucilaginosa]|uniref:Uncharacterized protein n=1 Tax=Rhodotorula mucilaginosa TaxID=5537 RepID=A0A9P6VWV2_RHOMI|nr:hypothetical protein C6P46_006573 [Rhodotorula mucilaginosa]
MWNSDSSLDPSSPSQSDDDSDGDGGETSGLRSLDQYEDSGVGFGNVMSPATAEAVELARGMKDLELSTEAQRSFFEFKALLENAHERGRQLLELTGDKVAEHVMESVDHMYERLQDAVLFFELQQDRLIGPDAERQLIDQYISEIMELKKNGQAERDQLKKELTTCQEDALKKIEALRASYDKQSRTLQNRLQKFGGS